ncbi:MAG: DUF2851 family protein [Bacteroidetes bacterium]|nr:DUF2851 family protein [Bacteroidota bacterium]
MTENLLQFIWQFQYLDLHSLCTTEGHPLQIIKPGTLNRHQGPDFINAQIKIGKTIWAGNIEIHTYSTQWLNHKHQDDPQYDNVILHVVWTFEEEIRNSQGQKIPSLEIQSRVSNILLQRYEDLMQSKKFVPCAAHLPVLNELAWTAWKQRLAIERLERKSKDIIALPVSHQMHWEEIFWWLLARNFGTKVNAETFELIAKSIPLNFLAKNKNQLLVIEALLLGQAGLLKQQFEDDYPIVLQKEYQFLAKKYKLKPVHLSPAFLRMRPANFPTIRLSQLAKLISISSHLFSKILEIKTLTEVRELLDVTANDYWHYHYTFDHATPYKPKRLGSQMIDNIVINTIIPVLFAYGIYKNDLLCKEKAMHWFTQTPSEKNTIIKDWKLLGLSSANALESQALMELKNNYCQFKRCLDCTVGYHILKQNAMAS